MDKDTRDTKTKDTMTQKQTQIKQMLNAERDEVALVICLGAFDSVCHGRYIYYRGGSRRLFPPSTRIRPSVLYRCLGINLDC